MPDESLLGTAIVRVAVDSAQLEAQINAAVRMAQDAIKRNPVGVPLNVGGDFGRAPRSMPSILVGRHSHG